MRFAKPATDGGVRISTYRASCTSTNGGVPGAHQDFGSPIVVAGLSPTKTYTCTVVAINKFGAGPPSAASPKVVTLPTVPGAPTITTLTPGLHKVTIGFKATSDGGAPISSYMVTCSGEYGARSHQAAKSPITIACVEGAEGYTCTVAAENRIGWSHTSAPSGEVVSLPIVPGAPTISSITAGIRSVTATVAKPVNDGGVRVKSYRITCTSSDGGASNSHQSPTSQVSVAGLSAGKTYTCTVQAINLVATGPPSAPSSPVVPLAN